jgi:hypothetical protein
LLTFSSQTECLRRILKTKKIKILNYNFTGVELGLSHALRVYENKGLRRIFELRKEEVTGGKKNT